MIRRLQQEAGIYTPEMEKYIEYVEFNCYETALEEAKQFCMDDNIQETLNKIISDKKLGIVQDSPNIGYRILHNMYQQQELRRIAEEYQISEENKELIEELLKSEETQISSSNIGKKETVEQKVIETKEIQKLLVEAEYNTNMDMFEIEDETIAEVEKVQSMDMFEIEDETITETEEMQNMDIFENMDTTSEEVVDQNIDMFENINFHDNNTETEQKIDNGTGIET